MTPGDVPFLLYKRNQTQGCPPAVSLGAVPGPLSLLGSNASVVSRPLGVGDVLGTSKDTFWGHLSDTENLP